MAATKIVKLDSPLMIGGNEVAEITVHKPTVGDEEDAMQQAVQMKRAQNPLTVEISLFAKVCRLPYDAVRQMDGPDYAKIRSALNELNGVNPPEEDENPTMPQTD